MSAAGAVQSSRTDELEMVIIARLATLPGAGKNESLPERCANEAEFRVETATSCRLESRLKEEEYPCAEPYPQAPLRSAKFAEASLEAREGAAASSRAEQKTAA